MTPQFGCAARATEKKLSAAQQMTSLEVSAKVPALAGLPGQNSALDPLGSMHFVAPDFIPSQHEMRYEYLE